MLNGMQKEMQAIKIYHWRLSTQVKTYHHLLKVEIKEKTLMQMILVINSILIIPLLVEVMSMKLSKVLKLLKQNILFPSISRKLMMLVILIH